MVFAANCTWESGCSGNPKEHLTCCQQRGTGGRLWCLKGEQQSSVERWPALCRTGEKQAVMAEQAVEPGPFLASLLLWLIEMLLRGGCLDSPVLVPRAEAWVKLGTFHLPRHGRNVSYQTSEDEKSLELDVSKEVYSVMLPVSCQCALCYLYHPACPVAVNYTPPMRFFCCSLGILKSF